MFASNDTWDCWPSRATLGKQLGCSPRTITRLLSQLVALGELRIDVKDGPVPLHGLGAGRQDLRTNRYVVSNAVSPASPREPNDWTPVTSRSDERLDKCDRTTGQMEHVRLVTGVQKNQSLEPVTESVINARAPALTTRANGNRADAVESSGFADFWDLYPRRVARARTVKAFRAAVAADGLGAVADGLAAWLTHWRAAGTEVQFVPYPTTWLNQAHYRDPPPPGGRVGGGRARGAGGASEELIDAAVAAAEQAGR
jgi:Helix-turn-helix domain